MAARPLEEHGKLSGPDPVASGPTMGRVITQSRYGGPEVLELAREPRPDPGPAQVLVRVRAASVNARDWHVMRGEPRLARVMDRTVFALRRPRLAVRGTDVAGVVEAVGEGVTRWKPGDAVFGEGAGTFAEYALASADQLADVPTGMPLEQAAALPLAATTALECLDQTGLAPGGEVLVNGASGGAVPTTATLERIADLIGAGQVAPVIDRTFTLAEAAAAVRYVETEHARAKVVVTVS